MRKILKLLFSSAFFLLLFALVSLAQAPNSFNYQAVVRDANGNVLQNQSIALRIAILQNSPTGTELYAERHTKTTNAFGLVNLEIGTGTLLGGNFTSIQWGTITPYLKIGIDLAGAANYTDFGTSKIASVPYASLAGQISYLQLDPVNQSVSLQAIASAAIDDPIFEIKNKDGIVMLGVYNEGVRINVLQEEVKGSKSGFAVGSFSRETKGEPAEIMRLTSDSVRFYIPDDPLGKSSKGGFAVGSFSRDSKGPYFNLLDISPSQARVYIDSDAKKSSKGGFAVGSFSREGKAKNTEFMSISPLNYFIGHSAGINNTDGIYNNFIGFEAGMNNTIGSNNSFIGYQSGKNNTSGNRNSFFGHESGFSNSTGGWNSFIGYQTGYLNTTGNYNTFFGFLAGYSANASYNSFIGYRAGYSTTSGQWNTFFGYDAGLLNTIGSSNIFIGNQAGYSNSSASNNVFLGNAAGRATTTGGNNIAIGNLSGQNNQTGQFNTFIGYEAGRFNTHSYNSFIGYRAGRSNTSGQYNTFFGYDAGFSNTSGNSNVFIGNKAGFSATGNENVMIGNEAGYKSSGTVRNVFIGHQSGYENITGIYNTYIGNGAGQKGTSGSNTIMGALAASTNNFGTGNVIIGYVAGRDMVSQRNIMIGMGAGYNHAGTAGENIFIGYYAGETLSTQNRRLAIANDRTKPILIYGEFDNQRVAINGTTTNNYTFYVNGPAGGTSSWNSLSDLRHKKEVETIHGALGKVLSLRGVTYKWNEDIASTIGLQMGFVAQEVENIIPEVVNHSENDTYTMQYAPLTALLVEAMKEQQQQIEELKKENMELRQLSDKLAQMEHKYDELLKLLEHLTQK